MTRAADSRPSVPDLADGERFRLDYKVAASFAPAYELTVDHDNGETRLRFQVEAPFGAGTRGKAPRAPDVHLPPEEVHALVSRLRRLRVAPFAPAKEGLDGVTFTLRIQHGADAAAFSWWCDLPKGWGGLRPIQALLEAYCAAYFHVPSERSFR